MGLNLYMKIKVFREYLDVEKESKIYRSLTTIKQPIIFIPGSWILKNVDR